VKSLSDDLEPLVREYREWRMRQVRTTDRAWSEIWMRLEISWSLSLSLPVANLAAEPVKPVYTTACQSTVRAALW
jgi:hypothetical protein